MIFLYFLNVTSNASVGVLLFIKDLFSYPHGRNYEYKRRNSVGYGIRQRFELMRLSFRTQNSALLFLPVPKTHLM
jgi:hypothetical protein